MKCVNCGNGVFIDIKLDDKNIKMKACTKCGHIEYFYRMDKVKLLVKLDSLAKQSEALEIIASNSNQKVEAQKEAEAKIEVLEAQMEDIKKKLNKLK